MHQNINVYDILTNVDVYTLLY